MTLVKDLENATSPDNSAVISSPVKPDLDTSVHANVNLNMPP